MDMTIPELVYYDICEGVTAFSTTRHGGHSTGNYSEFNINRYCGDAASCVRKNREALCRLLGIADDRLLMPHQVHLTTTVCVDDALLQLPAEQRLAALEGCDALMTDLRGVCIGVSTADCIPILLFDEAHHAVCAIHAGWRGTVQRIAEKAVAAMASAYGTHPEQLRAQVGPGIHLDSFEVGDEVYEAFASEGFSMEQISRRYPAHDSGGLLPASHPSPSPEKWHIDLPECNRLQLVAAGVDATAVAVSPVCTYEHATDFFSARRLGVSSGRIFTGIMMKETAHRR